MNKLMLAGAALLTLAGSAMAADMAPVYKAPIYKAPPPPVWSWDGFYIGGNVGYSWANWDSNSTVGSNFPTGGTAFTNTASPKVDGWLAGVQAGRNWQVAPQWVVGVEGDFQWTGERASDPGGFSTSFPTGIGTGACDAHPICTATVTGATTNDWKLPWFATLRGRLGLVADQTWLFYGTGGLAFGAMSYANTSTATLTITNGIGQVVTPTGALGGSPITTASAFSETSTRVGFAVGGGIEKMLTQHWTVKAEYLYLDFGTHTFLAGTGSTPASGCATISCVSASTISSMGVAPWWRDTDRSQSKDFRAK
jgi:outer membrane immunogenic protein